MAGSEDAGTVAVLHADSWRRFYRGAYADSFLDGDIVADRRAVWSARLADPAGSRTLIAEDDTGPVGFAHVIFDADERWGSLIDNLHVTHARRRGGIGTTLLKRAAAAAAECATNPSVYLWVLEQNLEAQRFYAALGGTQVEAADVPAPGGVPGRLTGSPKALRISWPDAALLAYRPMSTPAGPSATS